MSSPQRTSDAEGSEQPVREKLRTTSIAAASNQNGTLHDSSAAEPSIDPATSTIATEEAKNRGRPSRKRSHEDIADPAQDEPAQKSRHGRKRSRETIDDDAEDASPKRRISGEHQRNAAETNGVVAEEATAEQHASSSSNKRPATPATDDDTYTTAEHVVSPKAKKSRPAPVETESTSAPANSQVEPAAADAEVKQDVPRGVTLYTENTQVEEKPKTSAIPPSSGFANASASSPFSSLAGSKSPTEQQTSSSAFKSSAFGALAASSTSGFGSLAAAPSRLSSFGSGGQTSSTAAADSAGKSESDAPATKTFGGALGASSAFASAGAGGTSAFGGSGSATGFGAIGKSAFGSALGGGFGGLGGASKLGSFAISGTPGIIGGAAKPAKPFGAAPDDDEADEGSGAEDDEATDAGKPDEDEKDERFFERDIETGEENETTEYTCRAKLYNFVKAEDGVKKEWKERGLGVVRLNVANPAPGSDDTAPKARLVMRADGSHRVALNTPIVKGVKFGSVTGDAPVGGYMYFMGSVDGSAKLELLQMKLRPQFALELHDRIADLQKAM